MEDLKINNFPIKDNLSGLKASLKYVKTIFGDVLETKVTFCFDTSGSMYRIFYHFREHLVEKLFQMLFSEKFQKFNVVFFNSSIHQCFSKHVKCNIENIRSVIHWMNKPYYESRSNMLGGLLKSFEGSPDAVYLVTDGFPSNDRDELLSHLAHITKGRQIKAIMITNKVPPEDCALDFMEDVAMITHGSLSVISVSDFGAVEVIMPIYFKPRAAGIRRAIFTSFFDEKKDCSSNMFHEKALQGDPMADLPLVVPFISQDPLSGKSCPFYHPFYHWYWPQYWQENGPGPFSMWTKTDKQYHCMWSKFRESRAFISGRKYLETYQHPKHVLPYAGMMLINKKVLACNHKDSNNYYKGKVLSQVSPAYFLVKFDISGEYNEVQKTSIGEIIDLDDQMRHSINLNDNVLAPLNTEKESYHIGIVLEGCENRTFTKAILPIKDTKLTVKFNLNDVSKVIEPNVSIFLTSSLKEVVERCLNRYFTSTSFNIDEDRSNSEDNYKYTQSSSFNTYGSNNNNIETNYHDIKTKEAFCPCNDCFQQYCCIDKLHSSIAGRVPSPVDDGKAVTLDQITEQIEKSKIKEELNDDEVKCNNSYHSEIDDEYEEKSEIKETLKTDRNSLDSDDDIFFNKNQSKDEFTETDLNWCILLLLNKHSKKKSTKNERPPWKYWGQQSIPDVIDPPNSEPFNDPPFWGCLMPKPAVEWPSTNFQEVNPHIITNTSPNKMYDLFKHQIHQPSNRPKRDASVGRNTLLPEEITNKLLERRFHYLQGGYPKIDLKNPYKDSIRPILSSWSAVGSVRNNKSLDSCLNKLEKSRIESQIQRDESNLLRYIENKPKLKPSMMHFS